MVTSPPSGPRVLAVSFRVRAGTRALQAHLGVVRAATASRAARAGSGRWRASTACSPVELDPDAGHHRQRLVAAGGDRDLGDGGGERGGVDGAGALRHLRQGRVVLDRHGRQREPGAAADQLQVGADRGDVHRLGRQRLGDLGEQPAGDEGGAVGVPLHLDGDLAGDLVVEAGDVQVAVGDPQHHPGEHRDGGPGGQALGRPRHRVGERVALHSELHAMPPRRRQRQLSHADRCLPTRPTVRVTHRTLGRVGIGCAPDPVDARCPGRPPTAASGRSTGSPTVMIGF